MNTATQDDLYTTDFYAWTQEQAHLIRAGKWDLVDIANLVEEIETLGRTEKREVISRMTVLVAHMLKWQFQPERQGKSWLATLREQRKQLKKVLKENPSLRPQAPDFLIDAYDSAMNIVVQETPLEFRDLPSDCPYSLEQVLNENFFP